MAFNPSDYGLTERYCKKGQPKRKQKKPREQKNFLRLGKSDEATNELTLMISEEAGERISSEFGISICVSFLKEDGSIWLWKPESEDAKTRKLSCNDRNERKRYSISLDALAPEYREKCGDFYKSIFEPVFHDDHVVFKAVGKRTYRKEIDSDEQDAKTDAA